MGMALGGLRRRAAKVLFFFKARLGKGLSGKDGAPTALARHRKVEPVHGHCLSGYPSCKLRGRDVTSPDPFKGTKLNAADASQAIKMGFPPPHAVSATERARYRPILQGKTEKVPKIDFPPVNMPCAWPLKLYQAEVTVISWKAHRLRSLSTFHTSLFHHLFIRASIPLRYTSTKDEKMTDGSDILLIVGKWTNRENRS